MLTLLRDDTGKRPAIVSALREIVAGKPRPDGVVVTTDAMGSPDFPGLHEWLAALPAGTLLAVRSSGVAISLISPSIKSST